MNKRNNPHALAAIALLAVMALDNTACSPDVARRKPPTVCAYFDTSTTNLGQLGPEVSSYSRLSPCLPEGTRELIFRIDGLLERLPGDRPRKDDASFLAEIVPQLKARSGADNTYLNRAFAGGAEISDAAEGDVALVIASDWYEEGMSPADHAALRRAACRIAANRRVKIVVVLGAKPANSAALDSELAPLAPKLRTLGPDADLSLVLEALSR